MKKSHKPRDIEKLLRIKMKTSLDSRVYSDSVEKILPRQRGS